MKSELYMITMIWEQSYKSYEPVRELEPTVSKAITLRIA